MAAVDSKMESVVGVCTVSGPAVEEVAVVPVLAVALIADGQQVQEVFSPHSPLPFSTCQEYSLLLPLVG